MPEQSLIIAPVEKCQHSRFNTRKSRSEQDVERLAERITRNGFEQTRALWAIETTEGYFDVFAGGTRLEASIKAGLESVPVFCFSGLTDEEISRKADEDNENDEYHTPVSVLDVWAECHRLNKEEGWTQQRIADAKGWQQADVSRRISWHTTLPDIARKAVCDGMFDEGHLLPISTVLCDVTYFSPWLTTTQAQTELVKQVLDKHRGTSQGVKPTVKVVRQHAATWKEFIAEATKFCESLDDAWIKEFVSILAKNKARSVSDVNKARQRITEQIEAEARRKAEASQRESDEASEEAERLALESARLKFMNGVTESIQIGDSTKYTPKVPVKLLLTDPPYGVDYQSQRRKTTAKKKKIDNDEGIEAACELLESVLSSCYQHMEEHSTVLVFTGWRYEPEFRTVIQRCGFKIKGSLVWVKNNHGSGDLEGSFAPKHERIIHAVKGSPKLTVRINDVLLSRDKQNTEHPTEKPLEILRPLIEATTNEGDFVYDPFAGTGNTVIAAISIGRTAVGVELFQDYYRSAQDKLMTLAERMFENELEEGQEMV